MLSSAWCVFGASCSLKQNFMFQQWWHVCSPLALRGCPICREGVYKVCVTTGLWATLVCTVVGPSASHGEERNVKNSEQCPLQPLLCASHVVSSDLWSFWFFPSSSIPGELPFSLPYFGTFFKQSPFGRCRGRPHPEWVNQTGKVKSTQSSNSL